jgi:hypothetical protein
MFPYTLKQILLYLVRKKIISEKKHTRKCNFYHKIDEEYGSFAIFKGDYLIGQGSKGTVNISDIQPLNNLISGTLVLIS